MFTALLKAGVSFAEIDGKTTVALWQKYKALRLVALSCPTLCNPMDCNPPSSCVHGDSPGKNTGVPCPPPEDLPNPGIKPRSPALQVDSLLPEPPGSIKRKAFISKRLKQKLKILVTIIHFPRSFLLLLLLLYSDLLLKRREGQALEFSKSDWLLKTSAHMCKFRYFGKMDLKQLLKDQLILGWRPI